MLSSLCRASQKVAALAALAPTQAEPPFAIAQAAVMVIFILIGIFAVVKFRPTRPPDPLSGSDGDWLLHVAATGPIVPGLLGALSCGPPLPNAQTAHGRVREEAAFAHEFVEGARSTMLSASNTKIRDASRTVARRCAMTKVVRPCMAASSAA